MIDYELFCQIRSLYTEKKLSLAQIARELDLDIKTVSKWAKREKFKRAPRSQSSSKLDSYKSAIIGMLERHPYSAKQIFQQIRQEGYQGGYTILSNFVKRLRPKPKPAFLSLDFQPGECAQVDWGYAGIVPVGSTQRRLSFFAMVLAYSRKMYVEFTLSEKLEHFLSCHQHAFEYFNGVPRQVWVDNCKVAVQSRQGQSVTFQPDYLDLANHYGFEIRACGVKQPQQKGRVENAVGYVKKNFLNGLELSDFQSVNIAARYWMDQVANVRVHGQTRKVPSELFQKEELQPLHPKPYQAARILSLRANNQFRIRVDSNLYSVPCQYASTLLTLKLMPDLLRVYANDKLVAEHPRSYDRNKDFELPDHVQPLLLQRKRARDQHLFVRFLNLSPKAHDYYRQLEQRRLNAKHHVQKILALSEIHGTDAVARAIDDAFEYHAFSFEYIANIIEQRKRPQDQPGALHLTRNSDLLEMELPDPDLSIYERDEHSNPIDL